MPRTNAAARQSMAARVKALKVALSVVRDVAGIIRASSHAGPCPACEGCGEVWFATGGPGDEQTGRDCPVCGTVGNLDCNVNDCRKGC